MLATEKTEEEGDTVGEDSLSPSTETKFKKIQLSLSPIYNSSSSSSDEDFAEDSEDDESDSVAPIATAAAGARRGHFRTSSIGSAHVRTRLDEFEEILAAEVIDKERLRDLCFWGVPEECASLKATCWKLSLNYLPRERNTWPEYLERQRALYSSYLTLLFKQDSDSLATTASAPVSSASKKGTVVKESGSGTAVSSDRRKRKKVPKKVKTVKFKADESGGSETLAAIAAKSRKKKKRKAKHSRTLTMPSTALEIDSAVTQSASTSAKKAYLKSIAAAEKSTTTSTTMCSSATPDLAAIASAIVGVSFEEDAEAESESANSSAKRTDAKADDTKTSDDGTDMKAKSKTEEESDVGESKSSAADSSETVEFTSATDEDPLSTSSPPVSATSSMSSASRKKPVINAWAAFFKDVAKWKDIEKDIRRTHQCYAFFRSHDMVHPRSQSLAFSFPAAGGGMGADELGIHSQVMIRVLCLYARLNPGVEYVQGMNELLAPIYYVFATEPSDNAVFAEADAFFCFTHLMSYLADRFIAEADSSQVGILSVVSDFSELLFRCDPHLWSVLVEEQKLDARFYALRWLMLLMAMEFQLPDVLRIWDAFLSDDSRFELTLYFAVALVISLKSELLAGDFMSNMQLLQRVPCADPYELIEPAVALRKKFPLKGAAVSSTTAKEGTGAGMVRRLSMIKKRIKTPRLSSLTPSRRKMQAAREFFSVKRSSANSKTTAHLSSLPDTEEKEEVEERSRSSRSVSFSFSFKST